MIKITGLQIKESFPQLVTEILGEPSGFFSAISPAESVTPHSLIYVLKDRHLQEAMDSKASVVLVPAKWKGLIEKDLNGKTWILSPNPELLMALAKSKFLQTTPYRAAHSGVHPRAIIDPSAEIDSTAHVGPGAVIGAEVKIGAHSFIGANAIVEAKVHIGDHSTIHPLVYIGHACKIGNHCEVLPNACIGSEGYGYAHDEKGHHYRIPHSGRVVLHDNVHVGANTSIDRGSITDTIIGAGTKIDNQCHLAHNTVIGKNGLITAQFGAAGSCTVGDNFICGGKTSLGGHLEITNNVQLAGESGVTNDIKEAGQYGGYPLQPLQKFLKTKAAIMHLVETRKQVKMLMKAVGLKSED